MWHHGFMGGQLSNQRAYPVIARTTYFESGDGGSTHIATLSPAPVDGVLLVACGDAVDWNWTPPAGWTTIATNLFYKVASSEGTTFTFSDGGAGKADDGGPLVMAEITGVAASPVEDSDTATSTATTPAGTTLGPKRLAIAMGWGSNAVSSMTNSWTIAVNRNYLAKTGAIGYKEIAATGSTGTSDWDASMDGLVTLVIK